MRICDAFAMMISPSQAKAKKGFIAASELLNADGRRWADLFYAMPMELQLDEMKTLFFALDFRSFDMSKAYRAMRQLSRHLDTCMIKWNDLAQVVMKGKKALTMALVAQRVEERKARAAAKVEVKTPVETKPSIVPVKRPRKTRESKLDACRSRIAKIDLAEIDRLKIALEQADKLSLTLREKNAKLTSQLDQLTAENERLMSELNALKRAMAPARKTSKANRSYRNAA